MRGLFTRHVFAQLKALTEGNTCVLLVENGKTDRVEAYFLCVIDIPGHRRRGALQAMERGDGRDGGPHQDGRANVYSLFAPPPRLHSVLLHETYRAHSLFTPPPR